MDDSLSVANEDNLSIAIEDNLNNNKTITGD
jgi:hypothetical protein